ncbi:MAG: FxLYD domain-containing protein [Terriglobales bacterium]|jgi:uncharacterized protein YdeI (BOF family)
MDKPKTKPYVKAIVIVIFCVVAMEVLVLTNSDNLSTATSTTTRPRQPNENLQVSQVKWLHEDGSVYISGIVTNQLDKQYSYVEVDYNLYDDHGVQIGTAMTNVNNLEPFGKWRFKAVVTERNVHTAKLKEVVGH